MLSSWLLEYSACQRMFLQRTEKHRQIQSLEPFPPPTYLPGAIYHQPASTNLSLGPWGRHGKQWTCSWRWQHPADMVAEQLQVHDPQQLTREAFCPDSRTYNKISVIIYTSNNNRCGSVCTRSVGRSCERSTWCLFTLGWFIGLLPAARASPPCNNLYQRAVIKSWWNDWLLFMSYMF